ncbi:MAG: MFS transporter [Anaerolineae bacterium]
MARKGINGFRAFLVIWFGQLVSLTGSGLTGFALGVWVYLSTGSTTLFALIQLVSTLPTIVIGPIAGALVDRWDRRHAMILSDAGAALCTLTIVLLLATDRLELWHLYVLLGISSSFAAFQWPAYSAATTLMVPKEQYGRAAEMVQLAEAAAQIIAPVTAGVLVGAILVQGVMTIDLATFAVALLTLLLVRVPRPARAEAPEGGRASLLAEAGYGWRYIRARSGLFGLLVLFAAINFCTSMVTLLFTPLVLGFSTTALLGLLTSVGGAGFLSGSILMSVWGGPKRKVLGVYGGEILIGTVLVVLGLTLNPIILGACAFLGFGAMPIINGCSQAIWQVKTAPDVQGRVFSFRRVISYSTIPLAYLLAGPLADRVFNPLLADDGAWAGSLGRVIGVGPGRGIGALFIALGLATLAITAGALAYTPLRRVEIDLPDAIGAQAEAGLALIA